MKKYNQEKSDVKSTVGLSLSSSSSSDSDPKKKKVTFNEVEPHNEELKLNPD